MGTLAQSKPIYKPALRFINAISQSNPALITTNLPHGYNNGQIVRIFLPFVQATTLIDGVSVPGFGMPQINNMQGVITNTNDPSVFSINIDTTNFSAFILPPPQTFYTVSGSYTSQVQYAQTVPVGGDSTRNAFLDVLPY